VSIHHVAGAVRVPLTSTPEELFERVASRGPGGFMLDSAPAGSRLGRWSFLGARPFMTFTARGRSWIVRRDGAVERGRGDPFAALARLIAQFRSEPSAGGPPFAAGAVGFVSYEAGRLLEKLRSPRPPAPGIPDLAFAFYESILACDLARREAWVTSGGLRGPWSGLRERQSARAEELLAAARAPAGKASRPRRRFRLAGPLATSLPREEYLRAVAEIKGEIRRGEIYQANLTRKFSARWAGDPADLFLRLRAASPAPFSAWLDLGRVKVISSSPERFLRVRGRRAETRPIKGTRPRLPDPAADRDMALELVRSPKDAAEHVMIVDLERNDLGRVCKAGTVRVDELAALEVYPQVFHLTSTVTGRLRDGLTVVDALRAAFPGGSITGAPKIRSMDIISALEPEPRDVYTGALGWFSFSGDCDLSMVIRTVTLNGRKLCFGVGGGIVADSDPAAEYEETLDKAKGILAALGEESPASSARIASTQ